MIALRHLAMSAQFHPLPIDVVMKSRRYLTVLRCREDGWGLTMDLSVHRELQIISDLGRMLWSAHLDATLFRELTPRPPCTMMHASSGGVLLANHTLLGATSTGEEPSVW